MKYLYRQTGIVVESDEKLDSAIFEPIISENEKAEEKQKTAKGTTSRKKATSK